MRGLESELAERPHVENRSGREVLYLEVGTRAKTEHVTYPDHDLVLKRDETGRKYFHRNGEPY